MSKGYRDGAFALGLVVGGGIVLNLFLWSAYRANKNREIPPNLTGFEDSPMVRYWDWFIESFMNPYDTIAQWAMAVLSLVAVYLLWETLKAGRQTLNATRDMAADTRKIGEAQVEAHLMPVDLKVRVFTTETKSKVTRYFLSDFSVKNVGTTPSYRVSVAGISEGFGKKEWIDCQPRDLGPNETAEARLRIAIDPEPLNGTEVGYRISVYVRFDTIFTRGESGERQTVRFDYVAIPNIAGNYDAKRL